MWSAAKQKYRSTPSFRDVVPPSLHDKHHQSRTYVRVYSVYVKSRNAPYDQQTNELGGGGAFFLHATPAAAAVVVNVAGGSAV